MQISARDKKLLVYLLAIALVAIPYFFVAKPLLDKQSVLSDEINDLQQKVNHYSDIFMNISEYENRIAEAQTKYNETANKFFGGLNQDNTIMMVKDLENKSDVWIARLSFQDENIVFGGETTVEDNPELVTSAPITGLRQDLNIDYAAKYDDFKRFIEYVENYDERLFITSITATYAVDSGLVGGNIVLSQYAVTGTDKEYNAPDLSGVKVGNEAIFKTGVSLLAPETTEEEISSEETEEEESSEAVEEDTETKPKSKSKPVEEETVEEQPAEPAPQQKPAGGGII